MQFRCPAARRLKLQKTLFALEQARADVARQRRRWRSWQTRFDPTRLIFIDETGSRPTWRRCAAGGQKVNACWASCPRVFADPDLPWRTAPRSAHSALRIRRPDQRRMVPRLCRAAAPASPQVRGHVITDNLGSHQRRRCAARSKRPAPSSGNCRPIHRTSIRSSRPSPRSSTGCSLLRSAPSTIHDDTSATLSRPSSTPNAPTIRRRRIRFRQ
jgi:hypothetical protein